MVAFLPLPAQNRRPNAGAQMSNFLKACFVTGLTVAPVAIKEFAPTHWNWGWFTIYSCATFFGYWRFVFKPDERFERVRTPSLDNFFDDAFSDVQSPGERFPFRVNIYHPFPLPWIGPWLYVAYNWKGNASDPDHGKQWRCWCGLVGRVYRSGKAGIYRKGDPRAAYRLSIRDEQDTHLLHTCLAIPLRRPATSKNRISGAVTAVMAIDALSPAAAAELESWYKDFEQNRTNPLLEKAAWLSLYF